MQARTRSLSLSLKWAKCHSSRWKIISAIIRQPAIYGDDGGAIVASAVTQVGLHWLGHFFLNFCFAHFFACFAGDLFASLLHFLTKRGLVTHSVSNTVPERPSLRAGHLTRPAWQMSSPPRAVLLPGP